MSALIWLTIAAWAAIIAIGMMIGQALNMSPLEGVLTGVVIQLLYIGFVTWIAWALMELESE